MDGIDSVSGFRKHGCNVRDCRLELANPSAEQRAIDVLHDHEVSPVIDPDIVDLSQMRMPNGAENLNKSGQLKRIGLRKSVRTKPFDNDICFQSWMPGPIDIRLATGTESSQDGVLAD